MLENPESNVQMVQNFEPMSEPERDALVAGLVGSYERLAYLRPGYENARQPRQGAGPGVHMPPAQAESRRVNDW